MYSFAVFVTFQTSYFLNCCGQQIAPHINALVFKNFLAPVVEITHRQKVYALFSKVLKKIIYKKPEKNTLQSGTQKRLQHFAAKFKMKLNAKRWRTPRNTS